LCTSPLSLHDALPISRFVPRTPVQGRQIPAKAKSGRSSSRANQTGVLRGFVSAYSLKAVTGTRQRWATPSQGRQCGLATLRTLRSEEHTSELQSRRDL